MMTCALNASTTDLTLEVVAAVSAASWGSKSKYLVYRVRIDVGAAVLGIEEASDLITMRPKAFVYSLYDSQQG